MSCVTRNVLSFYGCVVSIAVLAIIYIEYLARSDWKCRESLQKILGMIFYWPVLDLHTNLPQDDVGVLNQSDVEGECKKKKLLPSFLYIGIFPSQSRSFVRDLASHPSLSYGATTEHHCLATVHDRRCGPGDIEKYRNQFQVDCHVQQTFESTPETFFIGNKNFLPRYFGLLQGPAGDRAVQQLHTLLGKDMKFIMIIHDPVEYLLFRFGFFSVMKPDNWWWTCYAETLKPWLKIYPQSQFMFLKFEDYLDDRVGVLEQAFTFLGVDPALVTQARLPASLRGGFNSTTYGMEKKMLRDFHMDKRNRKCREDLEAITGMDFNWPGVEAAKQEAEENAENEPDDEEENTDDKKCTKTQLPSFLYIGVGHSGSTSFAQDLASHPLISYGKMKEHHCIAKVMKKTCRHGQLEKYKKQFKVDCEIEQTFDASPNTVFIGNKMFPSSHFGLLKGPAGTEAISQLRTFLGRGMKIIMMIRDPVDYLNSRFGFKGIMDQKNWWFTCHAETLKPWFKYYPRKQFLFLKSEDYFSDRLRILNQSFNFLGVDPAPVTAVEIGARISGRRRSHSKQRISNSTRQAFHGNALNRKCREDLEVALKMKFDWPGIELQ